METLIRLNGQTAGRDKTARLLQYMSRILWHRLVLSNKNGVDNLKNLEFQLSTFRRLLRFGRCVDTLYSALPVLSHPDQTVRLTVVTSKICTSIFLAADHILWLGRADVCRVDTDKWGRFCNKYWLLSITMNLVRDFYEIANILQAHKRSILPKEGLKTFNDIIVALSRALMHVRMHRAVMVDTVKNGCDFFIPLSALGHIKLSPGTVGWLGVFSSLAGLIALVEPLAKLTPA